MIKITEHSILIKKLDYNSLEFFENKLINKHNLNLLIVKYYGINLSSNPNQWKRDTFMGSGVCK